MLESASVPYVLGMVSSWTSAPLPQHPGEACLLVLGHEDSLAVTLPPVAGKGEALGTLGYSLRVAAWTSMPGKSLAGRPLSGKSPEAPGVACLGLWTQLSGCLLPVSWEHPYLPLWSVYWGICSSSWGLELVGDNFEARACSSNTSEARACLSNTVIQETRAYVVI